MYPFDLNNEINFIVDTASPASLLPARLYKEHADHSDTGPDLLGPDGRLLRTFGLVELLLSFAELTRQVKHKFYVANVNQAILEMDALRTLGVCLDLAASSISFKNNEQSADQSLLPLSLLNYYKLSC